LISRIPRYSYLGVCQRRNWFDLWCHEGIKGWMVGCNIWPWPKRR